jgi:hypothetical protein
MAAVRAAAGDREALDVAHRAAMVLLTPGCFAAGQARLAVDLLAAEGYTPVYAQLISFDRERVALTWADSLPPMEPARRAVVYDLLLSAESLLLVLTGRAGPPGPEGPAGQDGPAGPGAMDRLARLKGHSDPARCPPASLRARLNAANRVINMLHTSATTADMVRELAILLTSDDLATAWRAAAAGRCVRLGGPFLDIGRRWCANSAGHVAAAVRCRLAGALAAESPVFGQWRDRCHREWEWVSRQAPTGPRAVIAGYRDAFPARLAAGPRPVPAALSGTGRARLLAMGMLEGLVHGDGADVELLRETLARACCPLDRWEWVVLASTAVSPQARSAPPPGSARALRAVDGESPC